MLAALFDELKQSTKVPLSSYLDNSLSARELVQACGSVLKVSSRFHQAVDQAAAEDVQASASCREGKCVFEGNSWGAHGVQQTGRGKALRMRLVG